MKNWNKLSILLLPAFLVSCSNRSTNNSNNNKDDGDFIIKENVEIDFLCMSDRKYNDSLKNIIEDFKNVEPNIKVNLSNPLGSGNYANLENIVVAGFFKEKYPDIVQCYPDNVVKYISRGYAVNIDKYLENQSYGLTDDDKNDYIKSFLEEGKQYTTSGTFSLPFCKSTELMYYNADALLGVDLSSIDSAINNGEPLNESYLDNLTWEELFNKLCPALKIYNDSLSASEKILVIDEQNDSAFFTYDSDENFFITLSDQYGYGYTSINEQGKGSIDFDNPGMKSCMKMLNSAKKSGFLQTKITYDDYVSELFTKRKCLFTVSSTAGLSYNYNSSNPFKIGVAKLPHADGKDYSCINQGPSVCILDHKDENRSLASYLFWKHLTNKANSSSWALDTGYMGIRNSSYQSEEYIAAINDKSEDLYKKAVADNLKKIVEVSSTTFNTSVFRGSSNARKNVGLLLSDCLLSNDIDNEIDDLFAYYANDAKQYLDN